jgi:hypothetical protein
MSDNTNNFGNTDPFSDEDAEQHQWKPELSEDDLGFSEEHSGTSEANLGFSAEHSGTSEENLDTSSEHSGTSGEYTDHPDPESLLNPYGDEEVSWD